MDDHVRAGITTIVRYGSDITSLICYPQATMEVI